MDAYCDSVYLFHRIVKVEVLIEGSLLVTEWLDAGKSLSLKFLE